MKSCFAFVIILLPFISLQSQNDHNFPGDEPYPAPVSFADLTKEEAAFINLFNNENVTNLHVYASTREAPDQAYYYHGTPILPVFKDMLPSKLSSLTYLRGKEPHAISSMRGNGEQLYLLRLPGENWNNKIAIYAMDNGELTELHTLASYTCNKAGRCIQQDSWLQDLNGDTLLDIITKKRTTRKNGKSKVKTSVYLMTDKGVFKKARKMEIEEGDYKFQELDTDK